jgi:hypothetical protein
MGVKLAQVRLFFGARFEILAQKTRATPQSVTSRLLTADRPTVATCLMQHSPQPHRESTFSNPQLALKHFVGVRGLGACACSEITHLYSVSSHSLASSLGTLQSRDRLHAHAVAGRERVCDRGHVLDSACSC